MEKRVEKYFKRFPNDVQEKLKQIRATIVEAAPQAEETLIYGVPGFKLNGNLVCYAAFKQHIGLYPEPSAIDAFKKQLTPYETSKGTIKFPHDKPIPQKLIKEIIKYKAKENLGGK